VLQSQINWVWPLAIWQDLEKLVFSLVSLGFTRDKLFLWASKEMNSEAFSCAKNTASKFLRQERLGRIDTLKYRYTVL
jgi:hypothetical protein